MKEKLKSWFTRNLWTKVLSVVIAAVVWVIIMSLSDPSTTITISDIPVERRNEDVVLEDNMTYEVLSGDKVDIKVTGARSEVENLTASDFLAYVDFNESSFNAVQIHVELRDESKKDFVEITSQSSSSMGISIVETETESFAVEVQTENVEDGYYAVCTSMSSKLLYVSGAKSLVDQVDHLSATVDLTGKQDSYKTTVGLVAVDAEGNIIDDDTLSIPQKQIQVEMTVLPTKEVSLVMNTDKITTAEGFGIAAVEYSPKTVQIAADAETLAELDEITVDYEASELMKDDEGEINLTEFLPDGVYLKDENTVVYVSVKVELLKYKDFTVNTNSIEIRDLPAGLKASFTNPSVTVRVYGIESVVNSLTSESLGLYVNLGKITKPASIQSAIESDLDITLPDAVIGVSVIRVNNPADDT